MASEIDRLERAAAQDPAQLTKLADTLVAAGRSEEAVRACRRGLSARPDDVALRLALGRALSAAGHLEEAQAALLDAVARQAKGPPAARSFDEADERTVEWHQEKPPAASANKTPRRAGTDLERVAEQLLVNEEALDWAPPAPADPVPDLMRRAFDARRARSFVVLWVLLTLSSGGAIAAWIRHVAERTRQIAAAIQQADARVQEATYEGDAAARDAYAAVLRRDSRNRKFAATLALASARLAADHGDDTDAAAWAMLRRSEKEAARAKPDPDERADRELRQARLLLALTRGEACPPQADVDGEISARCALQRGDLGFARKILNGALADARQVDLRALLALGSLELGAGDLDAADRALRKVLAAAPEHPRALVGRALIALERGETISVTPPAGRLGPTTEAWFHLAAGLAALGKSPERADAELDAAKQGIIHSGRLALLYGRARLQEGKVGEAEQAMRVAERLDPNDGDVAVLDAEVALAKGFEDKVVSALSVGAPTPRRLAVLGRALCLTGRYREAASALDAALARRPGDATAVTYRAIARAHLGDSTGAVRELERAESHLAATTPRYGLGLLAYEHHDLLKARSQLSRALEHNSESFRARALLGRVLRDLGKPKEALVELERVATEAPALAAVHASLGRLYLDLGRDRDARGEFRKVIDLGKATPDDKLGYAEAVIHLGFVAEAERALAGAAQAGALAPKMARAKLELQSWRGPKEALAAARALEKARGGGGSHDPRLAIAAANAWRRAGDPRRAGDDLRAALFGDPLHANLALGRLQLAQNDPASAEASFRAAREAWERTAGGVDDLTDARVGLGRTLLSRKATADAIAALEPCLADDPTAPEPHYWLARARADRGETEPARAQAERATELDDRFADAFSLLGDLSRVARKNDKARQAYKRYLELSPDGAQAKAVKAALRLLK